MDRIAIVRRAVEAGLYDRPEVIEATVNIVAARLVAGQLPAVPLVDRQVADTEWFSRGFVAGWDGQDWPAAGAMKFPNRGAEMAWQDGFAAGREDRKMADEMGARRARRGRRGGLDGGGQ